MKRFIAGVCALMGVVAATGCQLPAPGYRAPIVDSVTQTSPSPTLPGETVTIVLAVHDDGVVSYAGPSQLIGPTGAKLPGANVCTSTLELVGGLAQAEITVTCIVPTFASNGTWSTDVAISDRPAGAPIEASFPGTVRRVSFEVAGGSEDHTGPRLVSYQTDPAVIGQETPFTVTLRVSDDTPPVFLPYNGYYQYYKPFSSNSLFGCGGAVFTPVSATQTDITLSCNPGYYSTTGHTVRAEVGRHLSSMAVSDALGQRSNLESYIDVTAQAPGGTP